MSALASLLRQAADIADREYSAQNPTSYTAKSVWEYGAKHNASGTPATQGYAHGPGGVLTFPGVDPNIYSAMMGAFPGMLMQMNAMPSAYTNPVFEIMTGIYDPSGSNKNNVCDDAPTAGLAKFGKIAAQFGRYELSTREIELNRMGQRNDRSDPVDLRLLNSPAFSSPFGNQSAPNINQGLLNNEMTKALLERAVAFNRLLSRQIWTGSPANNSAGGGYKEMRGFDSLINTGYVDAETGFTIPAADPVIFGFNHAAIHTNAANIVAAISEAFRHVRMNAQRSGLDPVRWVLAMREELFWELTKIWPCAYYLGGCTIADANGHNVNIEARDAVQLRDQMRNGNFLIIDGIMLDVILDDGIAEQTHNDVGSITDGCFESDIYIIPMSVMGGANAVTYLEYFDQSNSDIQSAIGTGLVLARSSGNGAFLEWPRQTNQCFVLQAKIEPRIIFRTPWLSARITDVVYCPIQHTRSPFPSSPYFVNGGATYRSGPSYYGD